MTTFHDQQPQSRRAVRQSERADGSDEQAGFTDSQASAPQQFTAPEFTPPTGDMWDTISRRAAQLPPVALQEEPVVGRRAAVPPAPLPEPLNYSTQTRAAAQGNDGPTFRARGSAAPQPVPFDPTAQSLTTSDHAQTAADQGGYRVRDFSPGARSTPGASSWAAQVPAAPATPAADLEYHTEARFMAAAAAAPLAPISEIPASVAPINRAWAQAPAAAPVEPAVTASAVPPAPTSSELPFEHTLTRRELRAMQQAEEAASLQSQQPAAVRPSQISSPPVSAPPVSAPPVAAPVVEQSILQSQQPILSSQQPGVFPLVEPGTAPAAATVSPTFIPAAPAAPVASSPFEDLFRAPSATEQPAPVAQVPVEIAPAPVADEPSPWTPPTGHWSTQIDEDEIETTINRRVGSGSTTTSALVLPSIPSGTDIRGPLTSTGEIMLTGSIDLPRSLAATGQSDRYDGGGIDDLFDLSDHEVISTDSSPVRAIRAVSTHTSGHGVTHTQKPKGTRALTALLIAASSMAVVVAGLLVAAFAFNVF